MGVRTRCFDPDIFGCTWKRHQQGSAPVDGAAEDKAPWNKRARVFLMSSSLQHFLKIRWRLRAVNLSKVVTRPFSLTLDFHVSA